MTWEMTACVFMHMYVFFFLAVGYRDRAWLPVLKTKQHQLYFFAWAGALIDVVVTASYWSNYCSTGWRDWNWVSLLPCSHKWSPPLPSYTHINKERVPTRSDNYKRGLLINLKCSSEGRVMAGEEGKEWLLLSNLYLFLYLPLFLSSSLCLSFFLTLLFSPSPVIPVTDYLNKPSSHFPLFLFFPVPPSASCLTISWHAHREHCSSLQLLLLLPHSHPSALLLLLTSFSCSTCNY